MENPPPHLHLSTWPGPPTARGVGVGYPPLVPYPPCDDGRHLPPPPWAPWAAPGGTPGGPGPGARRHAVRRSSAAAWVVSGRRSLPPVGQAQPQLRAAARPLHPTITTTRG